jgi:hypothetical protein
MQTKSLIKKWLALSIVVLFVGTSITALAEPSEAIVTKTKTIIGFRDCSRDQTELRYYDPNALSGVCGGPSGSPQKWRTAIRLTQKELAKYQTWTLTKVVIGFGEDPEEGPVNVTIIIYDNGTPTEPGNVIVNDTWAILNGTALITVPLVTPVVLNGHDELWVCVQWTQVHVMTSYAYFDGGPAVHGKGDWVFINNDWHELLQSGMDVNWAIGAVVEGQWTTTLAIGNIKKVPFGFNAEVQNIGDADALNVTWSFTVIGGILGRHKTATGTDATLAAHGTLPISLQLFIVFGKIYIEIDAQATNAAEVSVRKSAFLLGPFLIGIK